MKLHYHPETDSPYIELRSVPNRDIREVVPGENVGLGEDRAVVGFDIDSTLEIETLPLRGFKAA